MVVWSTLRWCLVLFPISKTIPSTIITAPSTIIPKSIAPRLIKFAQTPKILIMIKANNRDNGITEAVMMPPRTFPSSKTNTKMTIRAPSTKLRAIVLVVRSIRLERSRNGFISIPVGSDFLILSILFLTASTTLSEFAPFNIRIMPPTASCPFWVKAP